MKISSQKAYCKHFLIHGSNNTQGHYESHKSMRNEALGNCYLRELKKKKIEMPKLLFEVRRTTNTCIQTTNRHYKYHW